MSTYHATKYDSAACEIIAALADESQGYGHASFGDAESPVGYVECVSLPRETVDEFVADYATDAIEGDDLYSLLHDYDVKPEDLVGHHLVTTNSQGFVSVTTFATLDELGAAQSALDAAYAEWLGEDD